jgi:hypothetical protein
MGVFGVEKRAMVTVDELGNVLGAKDFNRFVDDDRELTAARTAVWSERALALAARSKMASRSIAYFQRR